METSFTAKNFNRRSPIKKPQKKWVKLLLQISAFGFGALFLAVVGIFAYFAKDLPSPDKVNKRFIAESTKIYDRTGEHLLYEVHGEEKRTLIPFNQMSDNIKYATIILEDQDFYHHHGIKFSSIIRAALKDITKKGTAQGGSTITQQFIKNSILTRERTFTRKIKEVILAIEMEQKFSKDEILRMYLNEIPYGSNAYGIEAAAKTFFNKTAKELSLDEATLLASLPKAPTYYSPYGSHLEELKARQEMALDKMADLGYITARQSEEAKKVNIFKKLTEHRENIQAPHFVMYIKEYLELKFGGQSVEESGFKVYTTLDWEKQQIAEKAVKENAEKNLKNYNAENAALVAMDPKTGQILAMVGSKDYFNKSIDGQVNVAIRDRQPGSSFKPYVYLTAFTKEYTPETILFDMETDFEKGSDKNYIPQNYDGSFRGPLKIKEALGMSLNIPAVKTLYLAGVKDSISMAKKMGITSLYNPNHYGLSLVLGGGEVKLLDHVNGYATLATGGVFRPKTAILSIKDNEGKIIEKFKESPGERVVEEKYVAMIDHILSNNKYRAPTFGENNYLRFDDRPVAAKTGTTNEFRDAWTVGYTPYLTVGVWVGNNNNSPMRVGADGSVVAAPIWRKFMDETLINYNIESFPEYQKEEDIKPVLMGELETEEELKVCEIPEKNNKYCLANKYCPDNEIKKRVFANAHNILWYVNRKDPRGDYPENPESDPQFNRWEEGVKKWYEKNKDKKYILYEKPEKECEKDDFNKYLPNISLLISDENTPTLKIKTSTDAPYGVDKVVFYIDDNEINSKHSGPYETNYSIPIEKNNSTLTIKVKVIDKNGNEDEDKKDVSVSF